MKRYEGRKNKNSSKEVSKEKFNLANIEVMMNREWSY